MGEQEVNDLLPSSAHHGIIERSGANIRLRLYGRPMSEKQGDHSGVPPGGRQVQGRPALRVAGVEVSMVGQQGAHRFQVT